METVNVRVDTLKRLIRDLENGYSVCYNVDETSDCPQRTYPYATGYAQSTFRFVISDLKDLISK